MPMADTFDEFWQALITYGTNLLVLLNKDFCVHLDRILFEEARKNTDLIKIFSEAAYGRGHRKIAALIEHNQSPDSLASCDL